MANTRQSAKRARQETRRRGVNSSVESAAKTALRKAVHAVKNKDLKSGQEAYRLAVKAVSQAASKGVIPKGRAARKISRLTHLALKVLPEAVGNAARAAQETLKAAK